MRTSARNSFAGTVKDMVKGPVSTEVTISVAPNVDIVALISTRSAEGSGSRSATRARPHQGEQRHRRRRLMARASTRGRPVARSSRRGSAATST